jgi:hypothetical protein
MVVPGKPSGRTPRLQIYGDDAVDFEGRSGDKCELLDLALSS